MNQLNQKKVMESVAIVRFATYNILPKEAGYYSDFGHKHTYHTKSKRHLTFYQMNWQEQHL